MRKHPALRDKRRPSRSAVMLVNGHVPCEPSLPRRTKRPPAAHQPAGPSSISRPAEVKPGVVSRRRLLLSSIIHLSSTVVAFLPSIPWHGCTCFRSEATDIHIQLVSSPLAKVSFFVSVRLTVERLGTAFRDPVCHTGALSAHHSMDAHTNPDIPSHPQLFLFPNANKRCPAPHRAPLSLTRLPVRTSNECILLQRSPPAIGGLS
ncbi:hypothetical protein R3P38DRAFT_3277489 [Favolaschia claudopus]|uniref:Uncharacterized protein n=1 Tax=Favolaschia claudopus TaxID=2862362 RepID=A0AAW0AQP4_9AGAR